MAKTAPQKVRDPVRPQARNINEFIAMKKLNVGIFVFLKYDIYLRNNLVNKS